MHSLDLSNYSFESAAFEARFSDAYRLWDRAGELWASVAAQLPELKLKKAEPRTTNFILGNDFDLRVDYTRIVVVQHRPPGDLERFSEVATILVDNSVKTLQISDFTRVGLRLTYWRTLETDDAAARAVIDSSLIRFPASPLGKDSTVKLPELSMRWETRTLGVMVAVKGQTRRVDVDVPLDVTPLVEIKNQERHGVLQDVDYYTKGVTTVENMRPRIWIDTAAKAARKSLKALQHEE